MQLSYKWLRDYVECDLSAEELAERLTMAGIAVEGVAPPIDGLDKVLAGRIEDIYPHPDSDHLMICRVDVGGEVLQIVSGAPNLACNVLVPVAKPGVLLPTGLKVEAREFRGVLSEGVLCSGAELGTDEWGFGDDRGVLILQGDFPPGMPVDRVLGFDDQILEFELTPNRGDCQAVINIAREVRALSGSRLHLPEICFTETGEATADLIRVEVEEPELCRRYTGRIIRDVRIAPSPPWLQYRLRSAGVRPINNIVDVTNFVMLETGQPLHAFNYDMIKGHTIVVRRARPGEKLVSLDGAVRELDPEMLVIADRDEPVGLAGVIGGLASEVTPDTRTVFLESAWFAPLNIRRTSRILGLRTEAAQRFEKEVDINGVITALERAVQLIEELGAGKATTGAVDHYLRPAVPLVVRLRTSRVNQILGTALSRGEVQEIMERLDFPCELSGSDALMVSISTYRPDITGEIDLIEEVARLYGYHRIPATSPQGVLARLDRPQRSRDLRDLATEVMVGCGLYQVITYSFISYRLLERLGLNREEPVRVQNPLREEQGVLRTSLLPGMLEALALNYKRQQTSLGLFEVGLVFRPTGEVLPEERPHLGIIACGQLPRSWQEPAQERDFYYVKGILEAFFRVLGISGVSYHPWSDAVTLHPGRSARICAGERQLGYIGELHPEILKSCDLPVRVVTAQLDLAEVASLADLRITYRTFPRYPGITRDLAVVVPQEVPEARIREAVLAAGGELLRGCTLFDIYQGPQVPEGCRSLAYSLLFQSEERTLTDDEVAVIHERILKELAAAFGARLR